MNEYLFIYYSLSDINYFITFIWKLLINKPNRLCRQRPLQNAPEAGILYGVQYFLH